MSKLYPCQVLDKIEQLLKSSSLLECSIYRGRVFNKDSKFSVSIYVGGMRSANSFTHNDESLQIKTLFSVAEHEKNLDSKTFELLNECLKVLIIDPTLGLSFVHSIQPVGMSDPEYLEGSLKPVQQTEYTWEVKFRHSVTDMGAL